MTLALLDYKEARLVRGFMCTLAYLTTLLISLVAWLSIDQLKIAGTIANTISVAVGPLLILIGLLKSSKPSELNWATLVTAYLKSMIWLTYGVSKGALPMMVSHTLGLTIISLIFLTSWNRKQPPPYTLL